MFRRADSAPAVHPTWRVAHVALVREEPLGWVVLPEKTTEMPVVWGYGDLLNLFTRVTRQRNGMLLSLPMLYEIDYLVLGLCLVPQSAWGHLHGAARGPSLPLPIGNINYRINWQKFHAKEGAAALLGGVLVVNSFQNSFEPLKSSLRFVLANQCKHNSFQFIQ